MTLAEPLCYVIPGAEEQAEQGNRADLFPCLVSLLSVAMPAISKLTPETVATVKATIPVLEDRGIEIVTDFYRTMFEKYPSTASFFNRRNAEVDVDVKDTEVPPQVAKLGGAVIAYAQHMEDLTPILPVVKRICHMHVSRNVRAPHYSIVGECLLDSMKRVLGDDIATQAVLSAWGDAYQLLADSFIQIEADLRAAAAEESSAGYTGYKDMVVASIHSYKVSGAKTYVLEALDGDKVPKHRAGQYLSLNVPDIPDVGTGKTSVMLSGGASQNLSFTLYPTTTDTAAQHLLETLSEGDTVAVSVPCGPFELPATATELESAIIAGTDTDCGMLQAVAQDLFDMGVKKVIAILKIGACDDAIDDTSVPGMEVRRVEQISASEIMKVRKGLSDPCGVLLAPTVADVGGLDDVEFAITIE